MNIADRVSRFRERSEAALAAVEDDLRKSYETYLPLTPMDAKYRAGKMLAFALVLHEEREKAFSLSLDGEKLSRDGRCPLGFGPCRSSLPRSRKLCAGERVMEHLTPRQYWLGCALSNSEICNGVATQWQLAEWFGKDRTGIRREEICARQAIDHVEALIRALP